MTVGETPEVAELRRSCAQVTPGLWIGGELARAPEGVSTVVTLEATTAPLALVGVTELRLPFRDSRWEQVPRPMVDAAVDAVVASDGPVLVRCRYGLNRSVLVVCLALMCGRVAAEDAVRLVRSVRRGALTNPYFADLILTYPQKPRDHPPCCPPA
jgi:hypothetical protein